MLFGTAVPTRRRQRAGSRFPRTGRVAGGNNASLGSPQHRLVCSVLAFPSQELGDLARARALQERAIALAMSSVGPNHPLTADCLQDSGQYAAAASRLRRGTLAVRECLAHLRAAARFGLPRNRYGRLQPGSPECWSWEISRERVSCTVACIVSWEHTFGREHAIVARGLWEFGQTLADQGLDRDALPLFERALSIRRRTLGDDNVLSRRNAVVYRRQPGPAWRTSSSAGLVDPGDGHLG